MALRPGADDYKKVPSSAGTGVMKRNVKQHKNETRTPPTPTKKTAAKKTVAKKKVTAKASEAAKSGRKKPRNVRVGKNKQLTTPKMRQPSPVRPLETSPKQPTSRGARSPTRALVPTNAPKVTSGMGQPVGPTTVQSPSRVVSGRQTKALSTPNKPITTPRSTNLTRARATNLAKVGSNMAKTAGKVASKGLGPVSVAVGVGSALITGAQALSDNTGKPKSHGGSGRNRNIKRDTVGNKTIQTGNVPTAASMPTGNENRAPISTPQTPPAKAKKQKQARVANRGVGQTKAVQTKQQPAPVQEGPTRTPITASPKKENKGFFSSLKQKYGLSADKSYKDYESIMSYKEGGVVERKTVNKTKRVVK